MEDQYILRLLLAALFGAIIGIEREYRDKSAGFRTLILISLGSAMFTILSSEIAATGDHDVTRIASTIVSGIGFLGAGVILKSGNKIHGLTTAATIWITAALGMAIGAGELVIASYSVLVILFALWLLPYFEHWLDNQYDFKLYEIYLKNQAEEYDQLMKYFERYKLTVYRVQKSKKDGMMKVSIGVRGDVSEHSKLVDAMLADSKIISFN